MRFSPDDFDTYPGTVSEAANDRVPCLRFRPGSNGYARFVTRENFIPPIRIAGWLLPREANPSPGNRNFDGLHVHVGHVGNGRNYVASLLRRDQGAKINVEYGWRGYQNLRSTSNPLRWAAIRSGTGPELVFERLYHFHVDWLEDEIHTFLGNEAGTWEMHASIPKKYRIPFGSAGFRLDSLNVLGNFTVREL